MLHKTRVAAGAALTLVALTGCGTAAADATPSHVYSPLPKFATATPTPSTSPVPQASSSASPSPTPTAPPSAGEPEEESTGSAEEDMAGAGAGGSPAGTPAQFSTPGGAATQPEQVAGPPAGSAPLQVTERMTSTTTETTSTTVEGRVRLLVTCEGRCMLDDLSDPSLIGAGGPISEELLQQTLEQELSRQGTGGQPVTDDLAKKLTQGDWDLTDRLLKNGEEELVFSSVAG